MIRDVRTKTMTEYRHRSQEVHRDKQAGDIKGLLAQGMKEIKFAPGDEKWYINMAYTEGWKAAQQKSQRITELQPLVSK